MDNITLQLNSPITEDQWDAITDVDFENTEEILFTTKHKKNVRFVKAQQWIPVKWKPLNDLEREELEDAMGYRVADEEAIEADCKMPNDGDEIWICTKSGLVFEDIFCSENGMLSLEDGDIMDIVAWMPRKEPEPYKGDEDDSD